MPAREALVPQATGVADAGGNGGEGEAWRGDGDEGGSTDCEFESERPLRVIRMMEDGGLEVRRWFWTWCKLRCEKEDCENNAGD
jgi:hypothetical protein